MNKNNPLLRIQSKKKKERQKIWNSLPILVRDTLLFWIISGNKKEFDGTLEWKFEDVNVDVYKTREYLNKYNLIKDYNKPIYRAFIVNKKQIKLLFQNHKLLLSDQGFESYTIDPKVIFDFIKGVKDFQSSKKKKYVIVFKWPKIKKQDIIIDYNNLTVLGFEKKLNFEKEIIARQLCKTCKIINIPMIYVPDKKLIEFMDLLHPLNWKVEGKGNWYRINSKKFLLQYVNNPLKTLKTSKVNT